MGDNIVKDSMQEENKENHIKSEKNHDTGDRYHKIENRIDRIESNIEELESRINGINSAIDLLEKNLTSLANDMNESEEQLQKEIEAIKELLDVDNVKLIESVNPSSSELERLSKLPEEERKNEFNVRVNRAVLLYNNFSDISETVAGEGSRVLSSDIQTFLNGHSDQTIQFTQVHRVIDTFIDKTDDKYVSRNTDEGRAIIKLS